MPEKLLKVSVIVPVFNVKPYLEESLESVIAQSYDNLEIILVDDGSTDGSGDICDIYKEKDSRITVIHQENLGLSAARNAGLDVCTGEVIAFLDSDDAFSKDAISKMLEALISHNADMVECNFATYWGDKRMDEGKMAQMPKTICPKIEREGLYAKKEALRMQCHGEIADTVWNKMYMRKIWETLRFNEGHNYEDKDIILQLISEGDSVYIIDANLIMRRKHNGSITRTISLKNIMDNDMAYLSSISYLKEHMPTDFDQTSYEKVYESRMAFLYSYFFKIAGRHDEEKKQILSYLRNQISDAEKAMNVKNCIFKIRVANTIYKSLPTNVGAKLYNLFVFIKKRVKSNSE